MIIINMGRKKTKIEPFVPLSDFQKCLEEISPFCDTPFWTSGDVSCGFQT